MLALNKDIYQLYCTMSVSQSVCLSVCLSVSVCGSTCMALSMTVQVTVGTDTLIIAISPAATYT